VAAIIHARPTAAIRAPTSAMRRLDRSGMRSG
jgi:hypothetical protein